MNGFGVDVGFHPTVLRHSNGVVFDGYIALEVSLNLEILFTRNIAFDRNARSNRGRFLMGGLRIVD